MHHFLPCGGGGCKFILNGSSWVNPGMQHYKDKIIASSFPMGWLCPTRLQAGHQPEATLQIPLRIAARFTVRFVAGVAFATTAGVSRAAPSVPM